MNTRLISWWGSTESYWLKGALISLIIVILFFLLGESSYCSTKSGIEADQCYAIYNSITHPIAIFVQSVDFIGLAICGGYCGSWNFTPLVTVWPSWAIVGAFLGWLYGKKKDRSTIVRY